MPDNLNNPIDVAAVSVTATATSLLAGVTELPGQPFKGFIVNPTNGEIALGGSSVTAASGALIASGAKEYYEWSAGKNWFGIRTGASNVDVRILPIR